MNIKNDKELADKIIKLEKQIQMLLDEIKKLKSEIVTLKMIIN